MPWMEVHKVDLRQELIYRYLQKEKVMDLCREYGISRKTAYTYIHRFHEFGLEGLTDRSRRPRHHAHKTDTFTEQLILDTKFTYPSWGAKKLKPFLEKHYPTITFPTVSTISAILARHGLVQPLPRRLKRSVPTTTLRTSQEPNQIWYVDFKGQFQTQDQKYCYPLTITDQDSRSLLSVKRSLLREPNTRCLSFGTAFTSTVFPK